MARFAAVPFWGLALAHIRNGYVLFVDEPHSERGRVAYLGELQLALFPHWRRQLCHWEYQKTDLQVFYFSYLHADYVSLAEDVAPSMQGFFYCQDILLVVVLHHLQGVCHAVPPKAPLSLQAVLVCLHQNGPLRVLWYVEAALVRLLQYVPQRVLWYVEAALRGLLQRDFEVVYH